MDIARRCERNIAINFNLRDLCPLSLASFPRLIQKPMMNFVKVCLLKIS